MGHYDPQAMAARALANHQNHHNPERTMSGCDWCADHVDAANAAAGPGHLAARLEVTAAYVDDHPQHRGQVFHFIEAHENGERHHRFTGRDLRAAAELIRKSDPKVTTHGPDILMARACLNQATATKDPAEREEAVRAAIHYLTPPEIQESR